MNRGAMSSLTSPKRVSTRATTWGFLNSTLRLIMGSAIFPISRLSSDLMASAFSRPCFSQRAFSLAAIAGSILVPIRKFSDSTELTASAAISAKRGMRSKTPSHTGHVSAGSGADPSASASPSRMSLPRTSLVMPVPIFPNMRPRQRSQSPSSARARALSRISGIQSSMLSPQMSNPISAILSRGRWLSR